MEKESKRIILVVEDDVFVGGMYKDFLSQSFLNHDLVVVESIAAVKSFSPVNAGLVDVAILDGSLPDGMAWDALDSLRSLGFIGGAIVVTGGFRERPPLDFINEIDGLFRKAPLPYNAIIPLMENCIKQVEQRLKDGD